MTNYTWDQGADLKMEYIYKEGPDEDNLAAVDLTPPGYSLRMDVVKQDKTRVYTINSEDISDVDPITAGDQADTTKEVVLSSGAGSTPNITITVPRSATLPGGAIYAAMTPTSAAQWTFKYDIFLRGSEGQHKIDSGFLTVNESYTLWL